MKKILSVILAVMMLFGAMSVTASAESSRLDQWHQNGLANDDQAVLVFNLMGGALRDPVPVYNESTGSFESVAGVTGTYVMLPGGNEDAHTAGTTVILPIAISNSNTMMFLGWEYTDPAGNRQTLAGGTAFNITEAHFTGNNYGLINFTAIYTASAPEEDTMATVISILVKVFGAIIGILVYGGDTEQGVALMNKVLGGLEL